MFAGRMSEPSTEAQEELRSETDLMAVFESAYRPGPGLVGIESEKLGVYRDGAPLRYASHEGHPGVAEILPLFVEKFGWSPEVDKPGDPVLMLSRKDEHITLEPGSQFELSGAPHESLHALHQELLRHREECRAVGETIGLRFVAVGFHPFARQEDLDWVPKPRYPVMREYLPTRGAGAHDMMRRTATAQVNFDVSSERDAMRKLRAALALSVTVTGLFANSSVVEAKHCGLKSRRGQVWLDMDPDRTGLLPFAWNTDATLGDYVRWALEVPMFIVKRGREVLPATHLSFRRFMAEGLGPHRATRGDWETHLKTLFPEVRLGKTLEVRSADSVPVEYATALAALWTGLLYDDDALSEIEERFVSVGYSTWSALRPVVVREGLSTTVGSHSLGHYARHAVDAARRALGKRAIVGASGHDETAFLDPLDALIERRWSVGDALLGDLSEPTVEVEALVHRAQF